MQIRLNTSKSYGNVTDEETMSENEISNWLKDASGTTARRSTTTVRTSRRLPRRGRFCAAAFSGGGGGHLRGTPSCKVTLFRIQSLVVMSLLLE